MSDKIKNRFILWDTSPDGNNGQVIPAAFTPTSYTPDQVGSEGSDKISAHLKGVDAVLATLQALPPQNVVKVQKNPGPGQFSSIADALASITTASASNPFKIEVEPGVYTEPVLVSKPHVYIWGSVIGSVVVEPDGDHDVFQIGDRTSLSSLTIRNAPAGRSAISVAGAETDGCILHKITIKDCDIGIYAASNGTRNVLYAEYVDITGGSRPFVNISNSGNPALASIENFWVFASDVGVNPSVGVQVSGAGARLIGQAIKLEGADQAGVGVRVDNGARAEIGAATISRWGTGLLVPNVGAGPTILVDLVISDGVADISIDHPNCAGSISGSADYTKVSIDPSADIGVAYNNSSSLDAGLIVTRSLLQGDRHDRLLNLSLLVRESATLGLIDGGTISVDSGLDLDISAGYGFLRDQVGDYIKQISWGQSSLTVPDGAESYILINTNGAAIASPSVGAYTDFIILGRVVARGGQIVAVDRSSVRSDHYSNRVESFTREAIGAIFSTGSIVTESGTRNLNITGGRYYFGSTSFDPAGGTPVSFTTFYRDGSGEFIRTTGQTTVDNTSYDDGTGVLAPLTAGYHAKHALYLLGDGADEEYMLVYAQAEYSNPVDAEGADIPTPPTSFSDATVLIATIVVQEGLANLYQVRDERPIIGFKASGVSASSDHGNLSGLLGDDHPQYLLVSGTRAMAGALNMGSNAITNAGNINGVSITSHASRHQPNGSDPIPTAAGVNVSPDNVNGVGTSNSLSRADHTHALPAGVASGLAPDQVSAEGSANTVARADHVHNIPTAAAVAISGGTGNTQGSASTFARSDHTHAISTGVAASQAPDQVSSGGVQASLARSDHVHNIPTATAVSVATTNTRGDADTFARSDHTHQGVHGLRVNSGTYRFGDISLQEGVGTTITDSGSGVFTIDVVGGSNQLRVTHPATGLDVSYSSGNVQFNGTQVSVLPGTLTLTGNVMDGRVYVGLDGTVQASVTPTIPPNTIPLASYTTSASDVVDLTDIRVFIAQSLVWGLAADIAPVDAGVAASAGNSERYARADHKHAISTGTASSQAPDQSSAEGVSANLARADHTHNIPTAAAVGLDATSSNAQGAATTFARSDHTHAISTSTAISVLPDQGNAVGTSSGLSRADHRHNAPTAAPVALSAGTANTQGVANSFSRSDHIHNVPTAAPDTNLSATTPNAEGASSSFARADHTHAISTGAASSQTPDQANAAGTSVNLARADHVHNIPTAAAIGLSATTANAQGASGSFSRADHTHAIVTGAASSQAPDQANATGTSANLARADHVHNIPTAAPATIVPLGTNGQGAAATFARADHAHAIATAAPVTALSATTDDSAGSLNSFSRSDHVHSILTGAASSQTPDQLNATGTSANLARADHVHNIPTAAAVTLNATTTNTQGVATTFARSDHTHVITAGVAAAQIPDQTNAAGSSAGFARADHIHNIATAAPSTSLSATTTNTQGVADSFSRSDHIHSILTGVVAAQAPDQANAAGASANLARADHVHNIPTAAAVGLSATTTNGQGNAATFARSNHTHAIATGSAVALTTSSVNGTGSSANLARADHTHAISITNQSAVATGATTTGSASDVLMDGMTITPSAGTYYVSFSTSLQSNNNGSLVHVSIYVGGVQVAASQRQTRPRVDASTVLGGSSNVDIDQAISTNSIVTVNGSQAIEIRWRRSAGTATALQRTLDILKLSN